MKFHVIPGGHRLSAAAAGLPLLFSLTIARAAQPLSPTALVAAPDGRSVFVACATEPQVLVVDLEGGRVKRLAAASPTPTGLALSPDGQRLFVTCAAPRSEVLMLDAGSGKKLATLPAGHTAMAPVLAPDGRTLYVCNRFDNAVSFLDLAVRREARRVAVRREPVAAAVTPDGRLLLVANYLHDGRADAADVGAVVNVLDTASGQVVKELQLPSGCGLLREVRVSPDGRHAVVTHVFARHHLPTTQLDRGWMNTNAKTIIDLAALRVLNTVLLDNIDRGAANPWGAAWSADGQTLAVAHAGTHEVSLVDFPALLAKLERVPATPPPAAPGPYNPSATRSRADVPNDLAFLVGVRQRHKLPTGDVGPRAVAVVGRRVVAANYFSDTLSVFDLATPERAPVSLALGPRPVEDAVRQGERWFNDATICFQGWQGCASCHGEDGRVDGLNWDLLNDGIGNPKNNKSLLLSHRTPPAMSIGVREDAEAAVRAGIRHILFTVQPESVPLALDAYLKALKPVPSPHLEKGSLSKAARRGKEVFKRANCQSCHPPPLFTDLQSYDVGTRGELDRPDDRFDTPTLVEIWRTGPYLHDGSAATLRELFTTRNPADQHGKTSTLTPQEVDDLCAYLLSL